MIKFEIQKLKNVEKKRKNTFQNSIILYYDCLYIQPN